MNFRKSKHMNKCVQIPPFFPLENKKNRRMKGQVPNNEPLYELIRVVQNGEYNVKEYVESNFQKLDNVVKATKTESIEIENRQKFWHTVSRNGDVIKNFRVEGHGLKTFELWFGE